MTIVDGCIKAETGVGLSIASGNYILKSDWADLVIAVKIKAILMNSVILVGNKEVNCVNKIFDVLMNKLYV